MIDRCFPVLLALLVAGCVSTPRPDVIVHEGPNGGVYLERVSNREFQATHPVTIERTAITRVLAGLQMMESPTVMQTLFTTPEKGDPVFSDEDIAFLTPLITDALSRARPDQQVRFKVIHLVSPLWRPEGGGAAVGSSAPTKTGPQRETTTGTLYAHGLSLHITVSEYRHRDVRPDTIGGPNRFYPEQTDRDQRELRFVPASAMRSANFKQPWDSAEHTVVVDYIQAGKTTAAAMAEAPAASAPSPPASSAVPMPMPSPTATLSSKTNGDERASPAPPLIPRESNNGRKAAAPAAEDVQALKDLIVKKDMEVEALKKELRALKRQLDERDVQIDSLRKKIKPTNKSPDFGP